MRTLLAGEFDTATAWDADYYVKLEVQNGSGAWIDVGAALGRHWIVNARWSEAIDQPVSAMTLTLVPIVNGNSLSPLMATSPLNVDDDDAYAPLLEIGRLLRVNVATMPFGVALDESYYRPVFDGRIDKVQEADAPEGQKPITLQCSDLGVWLMDIEIESTTDRQYGTDAAPGTPLEDVLQAIIDDNIPAGEPAVTLYKESASTFAVTPKYTQQQDKLLLPLVNIVLDTTGEDLRYRYDASHASRLTWFNPDRNRTSVDATFDVNGYAVQQLDRSIDEIRNAGRIPSPDVAGTYVSNTETTVTADSKAKYRRHFMQLPASGYLTSDTQAQVVIDAAVNDLAGAPIDWQLLFPFLWFVQLFDRYTLPANGRQFSDDQTLGVVGFEHSIESGKGRTVLKGTGRVVGAYAAWRSRIALTDPSAVAPDVSLGNVRTVDHLATRDLNWSAGTNVLAVMLYLVTLPASSGTDVFSADYLATLTPIVLPRDVTTYSIPKAPSGSEVCVRLEARDAQGTLTDFRNLTIPAAPFDWSVTVTSNTGLAVGITDPAGVVHPTSRVKAYITVFGGTRTLTEPTSAPAAGTTSGTYTFTVPLSGEKHLTIVEPLIFPADGSDPLYTGGLAFDADDVANVKTAAVANDGPDAVISATFDTDTRVTAAGAQYSTDAGVSWTDVAVDASYHATFTLARDPSVAIDVLLHGVNSAGTAGPDVALQVQPYVTDSPSIVVTPTDSAGSVSLAYTGVGLLLLSIDSGTPSTPSASPIVVTKDALPHDYLFTATQAAETAPCLVTIPAFDPAYGVTFGGVLPLADSGASTLTVPWTVTGAPSGATVDFDWSVDGGASGTVIAASNPTVVSTTLTAGASGVVTARLYDSTGTLLKTSRFQGVFPT